MFLSLESVSPPFLSVVAGTGPCWTINKSRLQERERKEAQRLSNPTLCPQITSHLLKIYRCSFKGLDWGFGIPIISWLMLVEAVLSREGYMQPLSVQHHTDPCIESWLHFLPVGRP